jgi:hypothetical protein
VRVESKYGERAKRGSVGNIVVTVGRPTIM